MSGLNTLKRRGMVALAAVSLVLGVSSTGWMLLVVHQWALPWSTFKIFLPDPGYMKSQQERMNEGKSSGSAPVVPAGGLAPAQDTSK